MRKTKKSKEFTIATLNLLNYACPPFSFYQLNENYTASQWQDKNIWLKHQISQISADIIAFQEVFSFDALSKLTSEMGYPYICKVDDAHFTKNCEFTYSAPIVALCAKYPIKNIQAVLPDPQFLKHLGLPEDFSFSRKPIKAIIELPDYSDLRIYVVHLKSKRATNLDAFAHIKRPNDNTYSETLTDTIGSFISQQQRCLEGMLVFHDALYEQASSPLPSVILGDFNDELHTSALSVIFDNGNAAKHNNALNFIDAFEISNNKQSHKPFTLFYDGKGKVLDYILISNELNPHNVKSKVNALNFFTLDKHLSPDYANTDISISDHASIYIQFSVNDG